MSVKQTTFGTECHYTVFLVGFMGSGKTTVGRLLAQKLDYRFQDLDELIEAREGKTISEIFREFGEEYFRKLEREMIMEWRMVGETVVALGGGAFASEINRSILADKGITVWLDCPLDVCLERIEGDGGRPLLANRANLGSLYDRRRPAYEQADLIVQTAGKRPEEVAYEIVEALRSRAPK